MKWLEAIKKIYKKSERFFHLLAGIPSYDKYLEHMAKNHPDKVPKTRKEFFKEAEDSRYNSGSLNKC